MILGLTGGIGSGKSTVSKIFRSMNIKVFDADIIAKDIMESFENKLNIEERLGKEFVKNGIVDRELLKKEIFGKLEKLEILNDILHPKVIKKYIELYEIYKNRDEIVIFDVPLLFEVGLDKYCDKIMVVDVRPNIQIERVSKRDNLDMDIINKIISTQITREIRLKKADIVIENNGSISELENKVKKIIKEIIL